MLLITIMLLLTTGAHSLQYTEKAVVSARAARNKRWICFVIFLIIIAIVAIIIAVEVTKNKN